MKIKLLLFLIISSASIFAQDVLDKIVAVVDNEIICQSELDFQVSYIASQRKLDPTVPGFREMVLNTLIEDKLAFAQANFDSIVVTDEEVNQRIDYQIENFKQQYGSVEKIEELYGMSLQKIKRELRDNIYKNLMVQKLQDKNFGQIELSRKEVEDFFNVYKDSIGIIPEKMTISHIYKNPMPSDNIKLKYKEFAQKLLDSIKAGADFSELAKRYSEDPGSAVNGGDLGFAKKGVFFPQFESAAFALQINQVSEVIESPVGYHIIQLLGRRGDAIHTRHILIKIKMDADADLKAITFLSSVRDSIVRKFGTFKEFAKKYSEDKETAVFGGELGTFYTNQLDKTLADAVARLKEGEIGFPKRIDYSAASYGYHIVYLEKKTPQHKPSLDMDYTEIQRMATEQKRQKLYVKWMADLKTRIFWEIRL